MRRLIIAGFAAAVLTPAAACEYDAAEATPAQVAQATPVDLKTLDAKSVELAAATDKDKDKKAAKPKAVKKKKEKVEYMRAAPMK